MRVISSESKMQRRTVPTAKAHEIGTHVAEALIIGDRRLAMSLVSNALPDQFALFREHGDIRNIPVGSVFELRVANMLAFEGMPTCGDVLMRGRDDLIETIPQMGPKTAQMVIDTLRELAGRWSMFLQSVKDMPEKTDLYDFQI